MLLIITLACTPSRYVEPLKREQLNVTVAAGGAIFDYQGYDIPMPLSSVVLGYGIEDDLTAWGRFHSTSAIYGVSHFELGFVKRTKEGLNHIPSMSISSSGHIMLDKWEHKSRFYPVIDLNLYWQNVFTTGSLYLGINNWFELSRKKAHDKSQSNFWIPSLQSGYIYHKGNWNYNVEMKFIAPNYNNEKIVVDYLSPTDHGAIGLYFSVGKSF